MTNKNHFVKWVLHGIELPFHQNLIYWLSPTAALEQSLRAIWDAASRAAVLIFPQIKLNSQVVHLFLVNIGLPPALRIGQKKRISRILWEQGWSAEMGTYRVCWAGHCYWRKGHLRHLQVGSIVKHSWRWESRGVAEMEGLRIKESKDTASKGRSGKGSFPEG